MKIETIGFVLVCFLAFINMQIDNCRIKKMQKEMEVIKTVLIMKDILPKELVSKGK